jgi:hypothetical protein
MRGRNPCLNVCCVSDADAVETLMVVVESVADTVEWLWKIFEVLIGRGPKVLEEVAQSTQTQMVG